MENLVVALRHRAAHLAKVSRDVVFRVRLQIRWWFFITSPDKRGVSSIVVSLTSYPPRYQTLALTLKSLLTQSVKPKSIVLWIARGEAATLPEEIQALQHYGLEIRYCDNIKSYKKLIPSLEAFPEDAILTADDDVYYDRRWLFRFASQTIVRSQVLCARMHRIVLRGGELAQYTEWEYDSNFVEPSILNFPTGIGGVLYPAGSLHADVLDADMFMQLCPTADDVWFYFMAARAGSQFRRLPGDHSFYCWYGSQKSALWLRNVLEGHNDKQIAELERRFGVLARQQTLLK